MNCKPGDLAIVVLDDGKFPPRLGEIVRVAKVSWVCSEAWQLDPPYIDQNDGKEVHVRDYLLRPIRDPGDDATDETLGWLPVPTKETEAA